CIVSFQSPDISEGIYKGIACYLGQVLQETDLTGYAVRDQVEIVKSQLLTVGGSLPCLTLLCRALADVLPKLFRRFPEMTFLLSSELVEFLSHTASYDTAPDFFTNLVWAVGEFASPNESSLFTPRVITDYFEVLECVTFEMLGSPTLLQRERRLRLLCVLITSLSKLAVRSQDLVPRALLCLSKTGQVCGTECSGPRAVLERRVAELRAVLESSG
ncbi:hypothetical protein ISCGN_021184, partial [Ixodes scapularis]